MLALTDYEALLCPDCGRLARICQGPLLDGHIEVVTTQCQSAAALQRWRAENADPGPEPGTLAVTVVRRHPRRPLPPHLTP
ncbi:hypothetical protein JT358_11560 [Micrococcales bacterium 31B]|nr:hypothetical protein [Micrococcales bacterium 31B]